MHLNVGAVGVVGDGDSGGNGEDIGQTEGNGAVQNHSKKGSPPCALAESSGAMAAPVAADGSDSTSDSPAQVKRKS
ncbi:unnamed protein product, partial [Discosporangium mesarthrocarpum]